MFDISFSEVLVIAVVAMIVIGPQRLPKVVRTLGLLLGRAQRYVSEIKADIQREMELEELQKARQSVQDIGKDFGQSIRAAVQETEKAVKQAEGSVRGMESELNRIADDKPAAQTKNEEVKSEEVKSEKAEDEKTQAATQTAINTADVGAAPTAATATAATENKAEPQTTVPAFLQGEVALSIPDAPPASHQKPDA